MRPFFENKPKLPTRHTLVRPSLSCPTARPPVCVYAYVCDAFEECRIIRRRQQLGITELLTNTNIHRHACMHVERGRTKKIKRQVKRGEGGKGRGDLLRSCLSLSCRVIGPSLKHNDGRERGVLVAFSFPLPSLSFWCALSKY